MPGKYLHIKAAVKDDPCEAAGEGRLPQVLRQLHHYSCRCLLGQHSSSPSLPTALSVISHRVPISIGPCYQKEEAGIMGKKTWILWELSCAL